MSATPTPVDWTTLTPGEREKIARWLCEFRGEDPDEPISDGGHSIVDWVKHYDVPKLLALLSPAAASAPADGGGA